MTKSQKGGELPQALGDPRIQAQKLREHGLPLYYVEDRFGGTAYLTEVPLPVRALLILVADPSCAARWKGIVRFAKVPEGFSEPLDYGEYGFVIGNTQVFGDPALIRRIRTPSSELGTVFRKQFRPARSLQAASAGVSNGS
jgi:hypothetical protein